MPKVARGSRQGRQVVCSADMYREGAASLPRRSPWEAPLGAEYLKPFPLYCNEFVGMHVIIAHCCPARRAV